MAEYTLVCQINDLPNGSMKTFFVSGKHVALAHVEDDFFAVDDVCTHSQCSLGSEGMLDDKTIVCACHGASFDITSGKVLTPPATQDLKSYPVKIDGQSILVLLS
ncbi:non-heme iron oxygenase ferredoxin subunit [Candidatus Gottesmanbacteria bacterium]|nr:non-heme iron oxygenase ferredoxin subunit [Candidatus Gottesmanbacteria bacterium]